MIGSSKTSKGDGVRTIGDVGLDKEEEEEEEEDEVEGASEMVLRVRQAATDSSSLFFRVPGGRSASSSARMRAFFAVSLAPISRTMSS